MSKHTEVSMAHKQNLAVKLVEKVCSAWEATDLYTGHCYDLYAHETWRDYHSEEWKSQFKYLITKTIAQWMGKDEVIQNILSSQVVKSNYALKYERRRTLNNIRRLLYFEIVAGKYKG